MCILPCQPLVTPDAAASIASHPAFRDDRDTPLLWDETVGDIELIWVNGEQENFCLWDSTTQITPNLARRASVSVMRRRTKSEAVNLTSVHSFGSGTSPAPLQPLIARPGEG